MAQDIKVTIPKAEVASTIQSDTISGCTLYINAKAGTLEVGDKNNKPIALMGFAWFSMQGN